MKGPDYMISDELKGAKIQLSEPASRFSGLWAKLLYKVDSENVQLVMYSEAKKSSPDLIELIAVVSSSDLLRLLVRQFDGFELYVGDKIIRDRKSTKKKTELSVKKIDDSRYELTFGFGL